MYPASSKPLSYHAVICTLFWNIHQLPCINKYPVSNILINHQCSNMYPDLCTPVNYDAVTARRVINHAINILFQIHPSTIMQVIRTLSRTHSSTINAVLRTLLWNTPVNYYSATAHRVINTMTRCYSLQDCSRHLTAWNTAWNTRRWFFCCCQASQTCCHYFQTVQEKNKWPLSVLSCLFVSIFILSNLCIHVLKEMKFEAK